MSLRCMLRRIAGMTGLLVLLCLVGVRTPVEAGQEAIIYHAGSLLVPFAEIEKQFES